MQYIPAETIEQAREWWIAGIVVYKGWESGAYYPANSLNDPGSGGGIDNDPSHYFVILEA